MFSSREIYRMVAVLNLIPEYLLIWTNASANETLLIHDSQSGIGDRHVNNHPVIKCIQYPILS